MMKRLLVCLLSLCMLMSMFPAAVFADEAAEGEIHYWDEGKVTKEPTCEEKGEMTFTCTECGKTDVKEIDPLGHTPKGEYDDDDYKKPASCTEAGHEQWEHCANCGLLIIEKEGEWVKAEEEDYAIKATGHNYVEVKAQDPTCVEAGWEDYVHCENPVYGWDAENKEWKPLYLDEDGNETFEQTDTPVICGVYEEDHEKIEIPATGHTPVPDPTDENYKNRRCDDKEPRSVAAMEVAEAVLPLFAGQAGLEICSTEVTNSRLYIKVVNHRLEMACVGDVVQAGVVISNSEVGLGAVSVQPLIYTLACSNNSDILVISDIKKAALFKDSFL